MMMFLQKGEKHVSTFQARLQHGKADIHISNMRILIEEHKLGCVMSLKLDEMDSCTLAESTRKNSMLILRHVDSRYAELYAKDAQKLVDAINAAHASYKSALIKIGAIIPE